MKWPVLILSLLMLLSVGAAQQAPRLTDDQFVAQTLYPAVALLYSQNDTGNMEFRCTATAIGQEKGYTDFLTASHCVCDDRGGPEHDPLYLTQDEKDEKSYSKAEILGCGKQSAGIDVAALRAKTSKYEIMPLGTDPTSIAGTPIVNVAGPSGLGKQVFYGRVSSPKIDRTLEQGDINWTGAIAIQMFGVNGGSSGSAIVCMDQRAICGVLVGSWRGTNMIAIPIERFKPFYLEARAGRGFPKRDPFKAVFGRLFSVVKQ